MELPDLDDVRGRPGRGAGQGQRRGLAVRPGQQRVRREGPAARHHQRGRRQGRHPGRAQLPAGVQRAEQPVADPGAQRGPGRRQRPSTRTTTRSRRCSGSSARAGSAPSGGRPCARPRPPPAPAARPQHAAARGSTDDRPDRSPPASAPTPAGARARRQAVARLALRAPDRAVRRCVLFVLPLVLVLQDVGLGLAAAQRQPGARTSRTTTTKAVQQPVLRRTRSCFTLKYTVLATVLLIGLGLGLALLVQESTRWKGLLRTSFLVPSALGPGVGVAAVLRALLAARRPVRAADEPASGWSLPRHARTRRCGRRCSSSSGATPASTCC